MQTNRAVVPQGKVAYYRSDGTGRDTYIRDHNGGLLSNDRIHHLKQFKAKPERKFSFGKAQYGKQPHSFREGGSNKFPHYISDGSGRDYYVKNTEGGNSVPFRWRDGVDYKWKSSLRSHGEMPEINPEKQDTFMKTQSKLNATQSRMNRTMSVNQQLQSHRLSEPKKFCQPPPVEDYFKNTGRTSNSRMCDQGMRTMHTFYKMM